MKTILALTLTLLSIAAQAQIPTGFPFFVTQPISISNTVSTVKSNDDFEQRCAREGDQQPLFGGADNVIWNGQSTSGGFSAGGITQPWPGRIYYLKSLAISANRKVTGRTLYGQYSIGNYPVTYNQFTYGGESGIAKIDANVILRPGQSIPGQNIVSVFDADPRTRLAIATNGSSSLQAQKSDANTVLTNNQYSYVVTITNKTGSPTSGTITVTDALPPGCRFISASGTGWSINESAGAITATSTTVLANNGTSTFTVIVAPTITVSTHIATTGYAIDMDTDYSAPNIMPICGTSISNGSGASSYKTMYTWQLRNWLRDTKNYRIRRINRAISGSTTRDHEDLRVNNNRYDFDTNTGVFLYEHGVNDASQNFTNDESVANLVAMMKHKQRLYPKMTMLVLAPFPVTDSALEAKLAALSIKLNEAVTTLGDSKVRYVLETRTCFNPTTDTTDGIHPNDSGQGKAFGAIRDHIINNNLQL